MNTYICDSHRPAQAESMSEAGNIFALRKARREFGRSAKIRELSCRIDYGNGEFEFFIRNETIGHQVLFSVYRVDYEPQAP